MKRYAIAVVTAGGVMLSRDVVAEEAPPSATELAPVVVKAERREAEVWSATEGVADADTLAARPVSRPGELLEVVPGLIVTQHSGEGKANQYFLRGYNLDHGTDFALTIDGVPVNLPTHAHGQGYADTGFLIPELVDAIEYRKGPYRAGDGDFSAAGGADIRYRDDVVMPALKLSGGAYGYGRAVTLGAVDVGGGRLVYGAEYTHYDGPYALQQNFNKGNAVLRYSRRGENDALHLTLSGYGSRNRSPDQIPQRAVTAGEIGTYDVIDPTDGGKTYRFNLSGDYTRRIGPGELALSGYAFRYGLNLYSDFTYFLDDPVHGDQFEQVDRRNVYGGQLRYRYTRTLAGWPFEAEFGSQFRADDIQGVGLYLTQARQRLSTVSVSDVGLQSVAGYTQFALRPARWARFELGARIDHVAYDVANDRAENSGRTEATLFSPRAALALTPFHGLSLFADAGQGYHSNDARGTVQHVDARSGAAVDPVTPLAAARSMDFGLRAMPLPGLQLSASVFRLHADSELVYVGDAGTTEPFGASARQGFEWAAVWRRGPWSLDADYAYTRARFRQTQFDDDGNALGRHVPQAIQGVAAAGVSYSDARWRFVLRGRYFGPRALNESGSLRSGATTTLNAGLDYTLSPHCTLGAQVTNLLNRRDHDIDYAYTSRLPGEPAAGVEDIHFHPIEPINIRFTVTLQ